MKTIQKITFFYLLTICAFATPQAMACYDCDDDITVYPAYTTYYSYSYNSYPDSYSYVRHYNNPFCYSSDDSYDNDDVSTYSCKTYRPSSCKKKNNHGYREYRPGMTKRYNTGTYYSKALTTPYYYNYDNTYGPNFGDRAYDKKEVSHWLIKRNLEAIRRDQRLLDMANDLDEVERLHEDIQKRTEVLNTYGVNVK